MKIYENFSALIRHIQYYHKGELNNCIINYQKPKGFIELEIVKGRSRILMKLNDLDKKTKRT